MIRLFRVFIPLTTIILLVSEALLIVGAFLAAAFAVYRDDPAGYLIYGTGRVNIALVVATIMIGMYLHDLYSDLLVKSRLVLAHQLCVVMGVAFLVQSGVSYLDRTMRMPLHVMLPGSALALAAIFGWRVLFGALVVNRVGSDRLLLVGGSETLQDVEAFLREHPEKGIDVIGYVTDDANVEASGCAKVLGPLGSLRSVVNATQPSRIVVGMKERRASLPVEDLLDLRYTGRRIEEASITFERICGRVCTKELRPSELIFSGEFARHRTTELYQRAFNTVIAVVGIAAAFPFMLATAIAVRLSSPGPVLYRQKRVGMDGVPFTVYKFRSMRADAEAKTGAVWATQNDPRITPVGKFIRKTRLDELPQLFNVLRGEMSMVGPRPERPEFVKVLAEQIPYYRHRHAVRPGITGWAQINYKYGDTIQDTLIKLEYDLYYIKHMSFSLDLYIMFHTVKAMLLSRGAQ